MKLKLLCLLAAVGLITLAAWLVRSPSPVQADEIPVKYRETVRKGLESLVKNQHKDGHWEGDGGKHPVAMTGLVGLALLMECDKSHFEGRNLVSSKPTYADNIAKAVDWLLDQSKQGRGGLIFSEHPSETSRYMEGHGLATLFLAGTFNIDRDAKRQKRLYDTLTGAVKYIAKAQSTQGGWYHTSKAEGHDFDAVSTTVMQIQALQAAENARIPVPEGVIAKGKVWLKSAFAKPSENVKRTTDAAVSLVCLLSRSDTIQLSRGSLTEDEVTNALCKKWIKDNRGRIPVGQKIKLASDEFTHYYYAQAVSRLGDNWTEYRKATFDYLQSSQATDGSWPAGDGIGVGKIYSTAVWCSVMQLDKGSHPSIPEQGPIVITQRKCRQADRWPDLKLAKTFTGKSLGHM